MAVTVSPVAGRSDREAFLRLPWRLYEGDPNWVPPLLHLQGEQLSPKDNPLFAHADVRLFLARRNGQVMGRISAQVDHEHNRFHGERTGFFGFFEAEEDPEIARSLLGAAEQWLREQGMERVRGPLSLSINEESGLLIEGFDSPPMFRMPYSHPYYAALIEGCGYAKVKDLYAWRWDWHEVPRIRQVADALRRLPEITVRTLNMRRLHADLQVIREIFNSAWSDNWGFVPTTEAEATKMASDLRLVIDPNIVIIVEVAGLPAAVALAIPNLNEAIRDLNGRLFPLGFVKLLWRLKVRRPKTARLVLFGIKKEYRTRQYASLAYLLMDEVYRMGWQRGYQWGELSWTLEDNRSVNIMLRRAAGARHYKTYRIYEKALDR